MGNEFGLGGGPISLAPAAAKDIFRPSQRFPHTASNDNFLEQIPQELVIHIVVILHLGSFHERSQKPRTAIR